MPTKLPPHAMRVDGFVLPKPIGGHPALDFCNTWAGWHGPAQPGSEWLRSYDYLVMWAGSAGLLDRADLPGIRQRAETRDPARVLNRARELRTALYAVLRHGEKSAFDVVAAEATEANAYTRLVGGPAAARFELRAGDDPRQPLRAVALAAAEILRLPERDRIRVCPADDCGWLFLDRSGRRTWCDMASCGNRAKVRAHASRERG